MRLMKPLVLLLLLSVTGLYLPAQVQNEKSTCVEIEKFVDDSTREIKLYSPGMRNNKIVPIIFSKLIKKDTVSYSLFLSAHSDMVFKNGKGVIVVFTDNTVWTKQGKINAYQVNKSCEYNIDIGLTHAECHSILI